MPAKKQIKHAVVVPMLALAVAGCASLVSVHYDPLHDNPPAAAYPYALPETTLNVLYTVVLTGCGVPPPMGTTPTVPPLRSIEVNVTATIVPGFQADPDQYFYLPTHHLTGVWKTANVQVTRAADGTLLGLNGEMADQSLQVVGAGLQTVASLAGDVLTGGVKVPTASSGIEYDNLLRGKPAQTPEDIENALRPISACNTTALNNLAEYTVKKQALTSSTSASAPSNSSNEQLLQVLNQIVANTRAKTPAAPAQPPKNGAASASAPASAPAQASKTQAVDAQPASGTPQPSQAAVNPVPNPGTTSHGQHHTKSADSADAASAADAALAQKATQVADALKKITLLIPMTIVPKADHFHWVTVPSTSNSTLPARPALMKVEYPVDLMRYIQAFWIDESPLPTGPTPPFEIKFNGEETGMFKCRQPSDELGEQGKSFTACAAPSPIVTSYHDIAIDVYAVQSTTVAPHKDATAPSAASATIPPQAVAANDPPPGQDPIDGIVLRQPAVGFVRTCLGMCEDPDDQGIVISRPNSPNMDLATNTSLTLPQLGKRILVPLHTHVGDDVSINVTLAPDGSPLILAIDNKSTLAQGLTAMTGAATAYSGALTAQNAAVTAKNGGITAQATLSTTDASLNDTKLKSQADCIAQLATVVKLGGTPVTNCQ